MTGESTGEGLTDEQLDQLWADILHDQTLIREMTDRVIAKVRQARAEDTRRKVIEFPVRPSAGMPEGDGE